ncbi:MAG: NADH:ubiquinone reductase (Na(+)-transporting) subunit C [Bacteroidales bacterium]|nr:NADH:ubiquinone reductase (Na(+)-transporting) subunit C [Bacteroidales bacterium]
MNREGNVYTVVYASVMVILVAVLLAFTSQSLSKKQKENEAVDKMMQILRSVNVTSTAADAKNIYDKLIKESFIVNSKGEKVEGNAFDVDMAAQLAEPEDKRLYPVFEADIDGSVKYVLALRGSGLWGPIWGYISLDDNKNTVYGADFSHQGETPGLGAEISKPAFSDQFKGKSVFNKEGQFTSIAVTKPGLPVEGKDYVDGISGGTITSQGVGNMLYHTLEGYVGFLKEK